MITLEQLYRLPGATGASPVSQADFAATGGLQLYGADGKLIPLSAFNDTGIDAGPGTPLIPRMGNRSPRENQYPIGFNLVVTPRGEDRTRMQAFAMLRMFALSFPYLRIAINYRKQQLAGLEWDIVVKDDPKSSKAREKYQDEILEVKRFLEVPNSFDSVPFSSWIKQAYEEVAVTDALCFYRLANRGGDLHSLIQVDGTTIKPNIDEFGHIVGYQQILYGYPVTGYSAWAEAEKAKQGSDLLSFEPGDMVYLVHNPKVDNVYGTPPAEEILSLIQLGMSRASYQNTWYTAGTVPDGFLEAPLEWKSIKQLQEAQQYFDDLLSGNDEKRHTIRVIPFGSKYSAVTKGLNYSKDEEDALISAVCAYMGVPRSLFVSTVNRATGEMQRDEAQDTGFKPIVKFFSDFISRTIIALYMRSRIGDDAAENLEWAPVYAPAGNEKEIAEAAQLYVTAGILTANEIRAQKGLEPLEEPKPVAVPPVLAGQKPAAPGQPPVPKPSQPAATGTPGDPNAGAEGASQTDGQDKAVGSELGEWRRFALRRVEKKRHTDAFETKVIGAALRKFVEASLAKAATADQVRAVFEKAGSLAAKRKHHEEQLKAAIGRVLAHQKTDLLQHAKGLLPDAKEQAA
jgi:hypothetical protein